MHRRVRRRSCARTLATWAKALFGCAIALLFVGPSPARAQAGEAVASAPPASPSAEVSEQSASIVGEGASPVRLEGYVEAFYQWNTNRPGNGITHYRGFDNRHNSFTLSNVALGARFDHGGAFGRLMLQVGHTPSTYYLAEPERPGAEATNASGTELWKYVQEAYAGYRAPIGGGLSIAAGVFLSPIGPEGMAVHENWNYSRSNLFFGLPFYHTGVRAKYAIDARWSLTLGVYNGWNSVVDNNRAKSFSVELGHDAEAWSWNLLYFGGVERDLGAPEGRAFRHLFDAHATWHLAPSISLRGQVNGGFEPNRFGTSAWAAGALYARMRVVPRLFVALRGDAFREFGAENVSGVATRIFWPADWVASATSTIEVVPHDHLALKLEDRHDHAESAMFFGSSLLGDGVDVPYVANRRVQNTLTVGASAFF